MSDPYLDLAREALEHWGGGPEPRFVAERENVVYDAVLPGGRAALRLHRRSHQTEAAIRSELWWMEALDDAGLAVPRPLRTRDDTLIARLRDGRLVSALTWIDGEPLGADWVALTGDGAFQATRHRRLGRLIAGIHATADRLVLPPAFQRPRRDIDAFLGISPFWGRFWEHPALSRGEAELLMRARHSLRMVLSEHAASGADQGLIHADAQRENVLCFDDQPHLIDFDDCGFGFRLYDLGTILSQDIDEPNLPALTEALLDGYGEVRPLDAAERAMIPAFTLMRALAVVGWAMPRLAPDDARHERLIGRAVRLAESHLEGHPPTG
jgi:Ser/Thr protein kinase RdoA (MazF antagonist)